MEEKPGWKSEIFVQIRSKLFISLMQVLQGMELKWNNPRLVAFETFSIMEEKMIYLGKKVLSCN